VVHDTDMKGVPGEVKYPVKASPLGVVVLKSALQDYTEMVTKPIPESHCLAILLLLPCREQGRPTEAYASVCGMPNPDTCCLSCLCCFVVLCPVLCCAVL
jgi:hypothetical protein